MIAFPAYGTARNSREIINLAAALEQVANSTALSLTHTQSQISAITTEMIAIRHTVLQNRMALDLILAEKGGTCALIGKKCCTYIPDESSNITDLSRHITQEIDKIEKSGISIRNVGSQENSGWWPFNVLGNLWGAILHYGSIILLVILVIFLLKGTCTLIQCVRSGGLHGII